MIYDTTNEWRRLWKVDPEREQWRHRAYVQVRRIHWNSKSYDSLAVVQLVPEDLAIEEVPLDEVDARKLGVVYICFGKGYFKHIGKRSALGRALKEAAQFAKIVNREGERYVRRDR